MPVQLILPSVAAGELDPRMYYRVDLAKWHIGVKTMCNWIVHPQGGASNCAGTGWVGEIVDSSKRGRMIPFQFNTLQTYVLEFGDEKMRIITNGGYVTETAKNISAITQANPGKITTSANHGYSTGDRVYLSNTIGGMTELRGRFVTVTVVDADEYTIGIDTTGFTAFTSGGTSARLYTVVSPYDYTDLPLLKYEQSADTMTLTHPDYVAYKLNRIANTQWQFTPITFAPVTQPPTGLAAGSAGSSVFIKVTAINDSTGEESLPTDYKGSTSSTDAWTWNAVSGCTTYNIYKAKGSIFGFVAQVGTTSWTDSTLVPDISTTPPQQRNPFGSGSIASVAVAAGGSGYSSPTVSALDDTGTGATFTAHVTAGAISSVDVNTGGRNYSQSVRLVVTDGAGTGASIQLNFVSDGEDPGSGVEYWHIDSATILSGGSGYSASAYAIVVQPGGSNNGASLSITVSAGAVNSVTVTNGGYGFNPAFPFPYAQVIDSTGSGASLTATLTVDATTLPSVSGYHDGRQWFMATKAMPQTLWGSVSGAFNNMSVSVPTRDSDAITRTLAGKQVNAIKHMVSLEQMILFTAGAEWKVWPGDNGTVLTPSQFAARPQSYNGSSDIKPLVINDLALYIPPSQKKVRSLQYQWAANSWTGTDMSLLGAHLFDGSYQITNWSYARDPDSIAWGIRNDGTALAFTVLPEQQLFAWARRTTSNGAFEDVCCVQEGSETAVYFIVNRTIDGQTRRYVERLHTRVAATIADAWFLDCGLQYSGSAATTISGLWHIEGETVYALADGVPVGPFTVSNGSITLEDAASKVTVGKLIPDADIETIGFDQSDNAGSSQGRKKKINHVSIGLKDSANQGLLVGPSGGQGTPVQYQIKAKDLVNPLATAPSTDPALVTDLMHMVMPPSWDWHGRIKISASLPLPYTITGLMYDVTTGS